MKSLCLFAVVLLGMSCAMQKAPLFQVPEDYRSWKKPFAAVLDYPVPGHGATYRVLYANDRAYQVEKYQEDKGPVRYIVPDGAIIIKEVYTKREQVGKTEPVLTIMVKHSRDPRALDGWLYYVRKPGEAPVLNQTRLCVGCHAAANEAHLYFDGNKQDLFRDYLFVPLYK